jgi:hypothetical protein
LSQDNRRFAFGGIYNALEVAKVRAETGRKPVTIRDLVIPAGSGPYPD